MKVADFIKFEKSGAIFRMVDANKVGYMTNPVVLIEADRNVVIKEFGDNEFVGFEPAGKKVIVVYVK